MSDNTLSILQTAINALKADATLTALVGTRIYTYIPEETTYPYLLLTIQSSPENTLGASALTHILRIQGFSQYWGNKKLLDIKSAIYGVLERNTSFITSQFTGLADIFREEDNRTNQLVMEFELA